MNAHEEFKAEQKFQEAAPPEVSQKTVIPNPLPINPISPSVSPVQPVENKSAFQQWVEKAIATVRVTARTYAFEIFLVALCIAVAAFVILLPKVALYVGGVVAAVSGWIAYVGIRRNKEGK